MTCREKTYMGTSDTLWRTVSVTVQDNVTRQVDTLEHHVKHSPDGFSWGYHGSGPAELARCILWDHLHAEPAPAVYQDFKADVVARFEVDEWRASTSEIEGWLQRWLDAHPDGAVTVSQGALATEIDRGALARAAASPEPAATFFREQMAEVERDSDN